MKSVKNDVLKYIEQQYGARPEFLWENDDSSIVRHQDNYKWFGVFMNVSPKVLNLPEYKAAEVEILNVKCENAIIDMLLQNKGYLPAYHMNKVHWITIMLDGTVPKQEIFDLIDNSFNLTANKKKSHI